MKKMIIISMLTLILVTLATSVFAATSTLAEKIYSMGYEYGVTSEHKKQMDEYFTNNPPTAEEEEYILGKAQECINIMDNAGVKDVRKLSEENLNKIEGLVQNAASKIGLTVSGFQITDTEVKFDVSKNGKTVAAIVMDSNSTTGKKFVPTGANSALAVISLGVAIVAVVVVVKLRKNA